jgi:hypothetical protein
VTLFILPFTEEKRKHQQKKERKEDKEEEELFTYGPLFEATFFSFKILYFSLKNYKNSVPSLYQILLP